MGAFTPSREPCLARPVGIFWSLFSYVGNGRLRPHGPAESAPQGALCGPAKPRRGSVRTAECGRAAPGLAEPWAASELQPCGHCLFPNEKRANNKRQIMCRRRAGVRVGYSPRLPFLCAASDPSPAPEQATLDVGFVSVARGLLWRPREGPERCSVGFPTHWYLMSWTSVKGGHWLLRLWVCRQSPTDAGFAQKFTIMV